MYIYGEVHDNKAISLLLQCGTDILQNVVRKTCLIQRQHSGSYSKRIQRCRNWIYAPVYWRHTSFYTHMRNWLGGLQVT